MISELSFEKLNGSSICNAKEDFGGEWKKTVVCILKNVRKWDLDLREKLGVLDYCF